MSGGSGGGGRSGRKNGGGGSGDYDSLPGEESIIGGPGVIPFSTDKEVGWNSMYHANDQKVVGKMDNGKLRLDVIDSKSGKVVASEKFDLKKDTNYGTKVKGKYGEEKVNYLKVEKIPKGFPAYQDRKAMDKKLGVDKYLGNTRESITSTHPEHQRMAIHLDESGGIKSHQLIPRTATVRDDKAVYVPAYSSSSRAKTAMEEAVLYKKYTKS